MPTRIDEDQLDIQWIPSVATYNDLLNYPQDRLEDGLVCIVRDSDLKYTYDAPTSSWKLINISKNQLYDFSIPNIQSGDIGKVLRINPTENGVEYFKLYGISSFKKNNVQSIPGNISTLVTWDINSDTYGFYTSTDTTRLTVPAGIKLLRVVSICNIQNVRRDRLYYIEVLLNGNIIYEQEYSMSASVPDGDRTAPIVTGAIPVVQGDYIQIRLYQNSGGARNLLTTITKCQVEVLG